MRIATAHLTSISPYSQSGAHEAPKLNRETGDEYEKRTWRERSHVTEDGNLFIPPMGFKLALDSAAAMLSLQVPGKGKKTYTKFFVAGVMCIEPIILPEKKDSVRGERVYCNADGKRGSGTRVWRTFPTVDRWSAAVPYHVLADEITEDVFAQHLEQSGTFVGIGRFAPRSGGFFGRFKVGKITWATA